MSRVVRIDGGGGGVNLGQIDNNQFYFVQLLFVASEGYEWERVT